jgi:C-terminal processing protease CtpA/Prc
VDENASLIYMRDDIRFCTMQRSTPDQLLGIYRCYHRHEKFHYIKLNEDFQSTLAHRAGVKTYDRLIELNGVNIEDETFEQFEKRFKSQVHHPTQMLVCSPATYAHYRSIKKRIHSDIPTVKYLTPVHGTVCKYYIRHLSCYSAMC